MKVFCPPVRRKKISQVKNKPRQPAENEKQNDNDTPGQQYADLPTHKKMNYECDQETGEIVQDDGPGVYQRHGKAFIKSTLSLLSRVNLHDYQYIKTLLS